MGLRFRNPIPVIGVALAWVLACASTSPAPGQRLDRAFARIQVHEAAIERARSTARRGDAGCEQTCASVRAARHEQAALCRIARDIADADALLRCEQAERAADTLVAQAARRCGGP